MRTASEVRFTFQVSRGADLQAGRVPTERYISLNIAPFYLVGYSAYRRHLYKKKALPLEAPQQCSKGDHGPCEPVFSRVPALYLIGYSERRQHFFAILLFGL